MSCQKFLRLIPAIYGILIIIIITCIFTRGFTDIRTDLIDQLCSFNYPRTYVELYFLILIDSFVFIIYSFIFSIKYFRRLKNCLSIRVILIIFQLLIYAYSLSKFLIFYEWTNVENPTSPYQFDRFDYLAMAFIPLFALGGIFIWILFFRIINIKHTDQERHQLVNGTTRRSYTEETDPERQQLVNGTTTRLYTEETDPLLVDSK